MAGPKKELKHIRTLGKLISLAERRLPKIGALQEQEGQPVRSWVFSESPTFQRYQPIIQEKKFRDKITIQKVKDSQTQIFKDINEIEVMVKLPGTLEKDIQIDVHGDILAVEAMGFYEGKSVQYQKEILLPFAVEKKVIASSFKDNVLEMTFRRRREEGRR